jgi:hypothetical protein
MQTQKKNPREKNEKSTGQTMQTQKKNQKEKIHERKMKKSVSENTL